MCPSRPSPPDDRRRAARIAAYADAATRLALLSDRRLAAALESAAPHGVGIGGRSASLDLGGTRVFVKRVPLTDPELQPHHLRSTANLFGLPLFYQYGIGSAGFGAWRELAAHLMTTHWVLAGDHPGFPLLYHWRILPDTPPEGFTDVFGGIGPAVAHWDGSPAVRARLEAIGSASASLVLFLEHVPHTLADWLRERRSGRGPAAAADAAAAYRWAERALTGGADFLASRGFVHFDAHFANLLTDGELLYFADLGLALSSAFELAPAERRFLADHLRYDRCYTVGHLIRHHLSDTMRGGRTPDAFLRDWAAGRRPDGVPPEIAGFMDRHARAAVLMDDFAGRLLRESKRTPFPAAELARAWDPADGPADGPAAG